MRVCERKSLLSAAAEIATAMTLHRNVTSDYTVPEMVIKVLVWLGISGSELDVKCRAYNRDEQEGTGLTFQSLRDNFNELTPNEALKQYGNHFNCQLAAVCLVWRGIFI